MGIKVKKTLLIVVFFCSCFPAFSNSSRKILHLGNLQRIMKYETICGTDIPHPERFRFSHPGGGGRGGGHSNDGGSQSSNMQGGSATMPLYSAGAAAGAANDHHNHHGNHSGANRNYNCMEVVTLSCTILACLILREGK
ncbi:hypothetical protein ACS0TY_009622 [Phlomoides rotata]